MMMVEEIKPQMTGKAAADAQSRTAPTIVVGLGKTGLACTRFLYKRGVPVEVCDSRAKPPMLSLLENELPDVRVTLGPFDENYLARAVQLVVSPGVSLREAAFESVKAAGIPLVSEIELFAREVAVPVVAITGSNGKSTVTSLVGEMFTQADRRARVGGNLGTPALELLNKNQAECYVIELSSFQLESTFSLNACASTVLNLSPDHMDRYDDVAAYGAAKERIFNGDGAMILNLDDPAVARMRRSDRRCIGFTLEDPAKNDFGLVEADGSLWLQHGAERLCTASELMLPGRHNVANVLAAMALGFAMDLPMDAMIAAAKRFRGLRHRCQFVAKTHEVCWYNDSKGTNVGATVAAIAGIGAESPVVLIAGGEGKGADFGPLADAITRYVKAVVLFGRDAPLIAKAVGSAKPVHLVRDLEAAIAMASDVAVSGDSVVFSPACASFDMFEGYEVRGDRFIEILTRGLDS